MDQDRRGFIKQSVRDLMACCVLSRFPGLLRAGTNENTSGEGEMDMYIDKVSKDMTFCAYRCSKTCPILVASLKGDHQFLKDKAEAWSKDHGGSKIPEDQLYCYGCKPIGKPMGFIVSACTVRKCAVEKGYFSCVECDGLATCNQELWKRYPEHRRYVLKLQK
ncbi:DUF3795 domain-containing protein [bacterium]|nr:DUF3795 domain-containing protein [bacterium]